MRALGALLALAPVSCAHDPTLPRGHRLQGTEIVPLVDGLRLPLVRARVGGQGPFWFGLDTGTSISVVSPALVQRLGLAPAGGVDARSLAGSRGGADVVEVPSIELGRARFERFVAVVERSDVPVALLGIPFGGVLSMNVFSGVLATLDLAHRRLVLSSGELPEADGSTVLALSEHAGVPVIEVRIGERTLSLLLDSGSDGVLTLPAADRQALPARIGMHRIPVGSIRTGRGPGRLGSGFFERFVATFDQTNRTIRLLRNG